MNHFGDKVTFIWSVADLLRDAFQPVEVPRRHPAVHRPSPHRLRAGADQAGRPRRPRPAQGEARKPRPAAPQGVGLLVLQHVPLHLRVPVRRRQEPRRQPEELHQLLLRQHARGRREVRLPQHHRQARRVRPALPGRRAVQEHRPPPRPGVEPGDGLRLRGADPQVQRGDGREPRRALHAPRSHSPHGQPAAHPRPGSPGRETHRPHRLRLLLRVGRHVDHRQGAHPGDQPQRRRSPVRPGGQPGDVRRLQVRPVHQVRRRARRREHQVRQHARQGPARRQARSTTC